MSAKGELEMKKLTGLVVIVAVLANSGLAYAAKSKCEFSQNTVDQSTGEKNIQTKFDAVVTSVAVGESEAKGAISVILTGGQKYLAVKMDTMDHYQLPDKFAGIEDPSWHPEYRDFLDSLLGDATIFPAGSTARLDLDDQTSVILKRDQHLRVRTHYATPGQNPYQRDKTQKTAKKLIGFLAKALDEDIEVDSATSHHYAVPTTVVLKYPIDAESEEILKRAVVTGMRIEARDRYYTFGWRTLRQFVGWNTKSYLKIRDAMLCIDKAAGQ